MLQRSTPSLFALLLSGLVAGACSSPPLLAPPLVQIAPASSASAAPSSAPELISVAAVRPPPKLVLDGDVSEWGSLLPPPQVKAKPGDEDEPPNRWPPLDPGAPAKASAAKARARAAERAARATLGETKEEAQAADLVAAREVQFDDMQAELEAKGNAGTPADLSAAGSHLALAITNDAALIAAELALPAPEGIWLGVGSLPPELPVPGDLSRGGGALAELKCTGFHREIVEGGYVDTDEISPPEVLAACRKVVDAYAAIKIAHDARFTRLFKIDRAGAHAVGADGELTAISSAKVAWKQSAKGATFEVTLPLAALPRVAEAPLARLTLVARVATAPAPPALGPEQWSLVGLPDAISFEPYGELRARVWKAVTDASIGGGMYHPPPGLSYQPGEALKMASARFEGDTVSPIDEALYTKEATLGDVEVGHVRSSSELLAIVKKGKVVDVVATPGSPRGVIARDGELHVLAYTEAIWDREGPGNWVAPSWSVLVVAPDGGSREGVAAAAEGTTPYVRCTYAGDSPTEILSKGLDSFGFHADCTEGREDNLYVPVEALFRWDPARKKYTGGGWRVVATPKTKTKTK